MFLISSMFDSRFFQDPIISQLFSLTQNYVNEYNEKPDRGLLINLVDSSDKDSTIEIFNEIDELDFDIPSQYKYIFDETNNYLKTRALSYAIMDSLPIIESKGNLNEIRELVESALCKDLSINLGLDYFSTMAERLKRMMSSSEHRVKTYYKMLDDFINGGFPPFILGVFIGQIHGFKSNLLANLAARQVLNNINVVLLTLEMSEDAFAQRFDSILSGYDINKIYTHDEIKVKTYKELVALSKNNDLGKLFIKQFPTGNASVQDYRIYIRELKMRDWTPDILYVDYINLMKPSYNSKGDLYTDVKKISEELRALSFEFEIPVISVSQLNRIGAQVGFEEVSFDYIAESRGLPATADFLSILGIDYDALVYQHEVHYKISKNRLGGRIGETSKFYYDSRSLKMYDETEENLWFNDAKKSNDDRKFEEKKNGK